MLRLQFLAPAVAALLLAGAAPSAAETTSTKSFRDVTSDVTGTNDIRRVTVTNGDRLVVSARLAKLRPGGMDCRRSTSCHDILIVEIDTTPRFVGPEFTVFAATAVKRYGRSMERTRRWGTANGPSTLPRGCTTTQFQRSADDLLQLTKDPSQGTETLSIDRSCLDGYKGPVRVNVIAGAGGAGVYDFAPATERFYDWVPYGGPR